MNTGNARTPAGRQVKANQRCHASKKCARMAGNEQQKEPGAETLSSFKTTYWEVKASKAERHVGLLTFNGVCARGRQAKGSSRPAALPGAVTGPRNDIAPV